VSFHEPGNFVDLAATDVCGGPYIAQRNNAGLRHVEIDGAGEPDRLIKTGSPRPALSRRRSV